MPEKAMKMQTWTLVGKYFDDRYNHNIMYTKWIVAGACAGAATTVVGLLFNYYCNIITFSHSGCPSERAMVLSHIRKEGFVQVIRTTGLKGLYQGWTATLYRDLTFNTVFFTMREISVHQYTLRTGEKPDAFKRVALGFPAGCMASIAGCPYDVIKTRMQGVSLG